MKNKNFEKLLITQGIALACIALALLGITSALSNGVDNLKDGVEIHLGEYYVSKNDSLRIVDYSLIRETYILEDGSEINFKLIAK